MICSSIVRFCFCQILPVNKISWSHSAKQRGPPGATLCLAQALAQAAPRRPGFREFGQESQESFCLRSCSVFFGQLKGLHDLQHQKSLCIPKFLDHVINLKSPTCLTLYSKHSVSCSHSIYSNTWLEPSTCLELETEMFPALLRNYLI